MKSNKFNFRSFILQRSMIEIPIKTLRHKIQNSMRKVEWKFKEKEESS